MAAELGESGYVEELVGLLWPSASVQMNSPMVSGRPSQLVQDFMVLPRASRPRLLVPREPAVAAAAINGYQTSATGRRRKKSRLVAALARCGAIGMATTVVRVGAGADGDGIDSHIGRMLGTKVAVSIHLGPPRAVRKPVLQLLNATNNKTIGFAKVGVNELTRSLVAHEAATLAELENRAFRSMRVPELLHHGNWHGLELLVQSALVPDGSRCLTTGAVEDAMLELASVHGVSTGTLNSQPYLASLRARLLACPRLPSTGALLEALDRVSQATADIPLRFGSWHGDLTPWNLATAADGRALIWDWEHFETGVPLGYDVLHHSVHRAVRDGLDPAAAFEVAWERAPDGLRAFQPAPSARRLTAFLYAVDIASRYLKDGESAGETSLGAVASWLAPVLEAGAGALVETS